MKWINQSFDVMDELDGQAILKKIEKCARVCYKSEDKIEEGSAERIVSACIKRGHESVLEHQSITVKFITDRSVTHELVRHRLASYSQESQRFVKYDKITFINQVEYDDGSFAALNQFCKSIEWMYGMLRDNNQLPPQLARAILPNCTKTEIVVTANLREWRWIFKKRCAPDAHPQIRALMSDLLSYFRDRVPVIFDDVYNEFILPQLGIGKEAE